MELTSAITAVVTGGASGLGEATSRALAAKGVKVGVMSGGALALTDIEISRVSSVSASSGAVLVAVCHNQHQTSFVPGTVFSSPLLSASFPE